MSGVAQGVGPHKSTTGMWLGDVAYTIVPEERDMMVTVDNRSTSTSIDKLELSEDRHDLSLVHELSEFEACAGQVVLRITRGGAAPRTITAVLTAPDAHNELPSAAGHSVNPFFSAKHQDAYIFELSHEGPLRKTPEGYAAGHLVIQLKCPAD